MSTCLVFYGFYKIEVAKSPALSFLLVISYFLRQNFLERRICLSPPFGGDITRKPLFFPCHFQESAFCFLDIDYRYRLLHVQDSFRESQRFMVEVFWIQR